MQLIIGNKNYSSWSLRPWLLMQHFDLDFAEQQLWLYQQDTNEQLAVHCPNSKVPVLIDNDLRVWDSLSICEYINERYLANKALPTAINKRAEMRSICAEMHSGFSALRDEMPMNCRREKSAIRLSAAAEKDIARIIQIFSTVLEKKPTAEHFLFGEFSIADAFFMPVVVRFSIYAIQLPKIVQQYHNKMLQLPAYQQWLRAAEQELPTIDTAQR
ncbi:MAG: hypothetical protein OFPII_18000 [Osedax symbiont Rs1]|nr:MAG: hypothetical protein OFPII_18000 [Osedax symbiont Rs1]